MRKKIYAALVAACLLTLIFGAHTAQASNHPSIFLDNSLDEPILSVKILYITQDDGKWPSRSDKIIQPDTFGYFKTDEGEEPELIIVYLATVSYAFPVYLQSSTEQDIRLNVSYEDGVSYLKVADDPEQVFIGVEQKLFYPESGDYAVDRDYLSDCGTYDDVIKLIQETAQEAGGDAGKNAMAQFTPLETFGDSETLYFPVAWTSDHLGYGSLLKINNSSATDELILYVSVPLNDEPANTIDDLMSDLRVDGYRPSKFQYRLNDNGETVNFLRGEGDKYDDQDVIQEALAAAMEKDDLVESEILWVKEEAFEKAKETGESPDGPFVAVRITPKLLQAKFIQAQ